MPVSSNGVFAWLETLGDQDGGFDGSPVDSTVSEIMDIEKS